MSSASNYSFCQIMLRFSNYQTANFDFENIQITQAELKHTNPIQGEIAQTIHAYSVQKLNNIGQINIKFMLLKTNYRIYRLELQITGYQKLIIEDLQGYLMQSSSFNFPYLIMPANNNYYTLTKIPTATYTWAVYGNGSLPLYDFNLKIKHGNTIVYNSYQRFGNATLLANKTYTLCFSCSGYKSHNININVVEYARINQTIRLQSVNLGQDISEKGKLSLKLYTKNGHNQINLPNDFLILGYKLSPKKLLTSSGYQQPRRCEINFAYSSFLHNHFVLSNSLAGDYLVKIYKGNNLVLTGFSSTADASSDTTTISLIVYDFTGLFSLYSPKITIPKVQKQDYALMPTQVCLHTCLQAYMQAGGFNYNYSLVLPSLVTNFSSQVNQIFNTWNQQQSNPNINGSKYFSGFVSKQQGSGQFKKTVVDYNTIVVYRVKFYGDSSLVNGYYTLHKNENNTISVYNGMPRITGNRITYEEFQTSFTIHYENQKFDGGIYQAAIPNDINTRTCYALHNYKVYSTLMHNFDDLIPIKNDCDSAIDVIKTILYSKLQILYCSNSGNFSFKRKDMLENSGLTLVAGTHFDKNDILSISTQKAEIKQVSSYADNLADIDFFNRIVANINQNNQNALSNYTISGNLTKLANQNLSLGQKIKYKNMIYILTSIGLDEAEGAFECEFLSKSKNQSNNIVTL